MTAALSTDLLAESAADLGTLSAAALDGTLDASAAVGALTAVWPPGR